MKKHRNFLIFYSLWLGVIISLLMIFDTPDSKNMEMISDNSSVCSSNKEVTNFAKSTKSKLEWCGDTKLQQSDSNKGNGKEGLDEI